MATLDERYTQLVDSLQGPLGFALEPGIEDMHQILLVPTFHRPCGVCLLNDAHEPLLSLHVLLDARPEATGSHRRWEDIAVCSSAQFHRLHALLACIAPNKVDEEEARSRDGIIISVRWRDATATHSAFLTNSSLSSEPAHRALMDGLFDTVRALFGHLPAPPAIGDTIDAYLSQVQRYWNHAA